MADINGPAIKTALVEELLKSVKNPEDLLGEGMGINPRAYLRDTLAKILAGEKNLVALLPETYAASRAERAPPSRCRCIVRCDDINGA